MKYNILKRTKQKKQTKPVYGFDIETHDNNKELTLAVITGDDYTETFFDKRETIEAFKDKQFKNAIIIATNLGFDYHGLFFNEPEAMDFSMLYRGSHLVTAKTFITPQGFKRVNERNQRHKPIIFLDTMNYAPFSVETWGQMLKLPKAEKPPFLGVCPSTQAQWQQLMTYNLRDAEVSKAAYEFLRNAFETLGATMKITLASTAMSLYTNKFIERDYFRHDEETLLEQFEGYYGGRTEAFKRGFIQSNDSEQWKVYDINSEYPHAMMQGFPNPNRLRKRTGAKQNIIEDFHGTSLVTVTVPVMRYPPLPFPKKSPSGKREKLLFPCGTFTAWQNHLELREALKRGVTIDKIFKTHYYPEEIYPFKGYVQTLYNQRLKYQKENNPMEVVAKLLLNSLYGKTGQKFMKREKILPNTANIDELQASGTQFEVIGNYVRTVKDEEPAKYCFPIWASCVTAYGRIQLLKLMEESQAIYVDTDSLTTTKSLPTGTKLGELKLEHTIVTGMFVKPKFYAFTCDCKKCVEKNKTQKIKLKGVGYHMFMRDFDKLVAVNPTEDIKHNVTYQRFMKFRESIRRGMIPNQVMTIIKELSLEDDKRLWLGNFSGLLEDSQSVIIQDGIQQPVQQILSSQIQAAQFRMRNAHQLTVIIEQAPNVRKPDPDALRQHRLNHPP